MEKFERDGKNLAIFLTIFYVFWRNPDRKGEMKFNKGTYSLRFSISYVIPFECLLLA
jgi:hypothetical protein